MGRHTREEIEALLRDNLKVFCEKNFEFRNELTVAAHISFSSDSNATIVCDVQETIPAQGPLPDEVSSRVVTRRRGRPKRRAVPRDNDKKPVENHSKITTVIKTDKKSEKTPFENTEMVIKTEPASNESPVEVLPSEVVVSAGDFSVSSPKNEPSSMSDDDETEDDTRDDADYNPKYTAKTPTTRKRSKCGVTKKPEEAVAGKYACGFCDKVYDKPSRLRVHKRGHTGDRPYTCPMCKKSYRSAGSLTTHKKKGCLDGRRKASLQTLAQPVVDAVSTAVSDEAPAEPKEETVAPKSRDCRFCGRNFTKPSRLLCHERTHTGERPFPCTKCDKSYISLQGLTTHHIRGCTDRRTKQSRASRNIITIRNTHRHMCRHCGKAYAKYSRLIVHERTKHTGERPFLCATCGKSFASKMTLNQHTLIHTSGKNFICSVCDSRFLMSYTLKIHMRIHTDERPHVCWHCGRAFRQYGSFQVHLRTHTKERPLKCSKCDQCFAHRSLQLKHEMMHQGDRQFNCTQCEKRFWTSHELKTHVRTHLGIKRHICSICNMRFTQISSLKRHVDGHSGRNKSHNCPMCGKTFTRAHQVSIHMKVHIADSPYRCQICHTNFKSMSGRRAHVALHHPEQQAEQPAGQPAGQSTGQPAGQPTGHKPPEEAVQPDRTTAEAELSQGTDQHQQHPATEPLQQGNPYLRTMLQLDPQQHPVPGSQSQPQLALPMQIVTAPMAPLLPHTLTPTGHQVTDPMYHHHQPM